MIGRTVCYHHGGKTPVGFGLPQTKTGRYSKYLPTRLGERYDQARTDPNLLALREEIALVDSRLADLLGRVDSGESGRLWGALGQTYADFLSARNGGKVDEMRVLLDRLGGLIGQGQADYAAWADVGEQLDRRRKLVESERKRLVELQQVITTERAMVLLATVVDVIRRHVTDRSTLAAISADIGGLVAAGTGQRAES